MENNCFDSQKALQNHVSSKIGRWSSTLEYPDTKADLAILRSFAGKRPFDSIKPWPILLNGDEDQVNLILSNYQYGRNNRLYGLSCGQVALYHSLIFFALHQQGISDKSMHKPGVTMGSALKNLVYNKISDPEQGDDSIAESIENKKKKIYNRLISLSGKKDLFMQMNAIRGLIDLLHTNKIPVDYSQLAEDLFNIQFPKNKDSVLIRWINDFNRTHH